jgi:hypothetical protein
MKLQINFRCWLRVLIAVATMSLSGSLAAETKTEDEPTPKLLHVFPAAVYANEEFKYPLYEITVVGENLPSGEKLKIYLDDREADTKSVDDTGVPPRKSSIGETAEDSTKDPPREVYRQKANDGSQLKLWINKNRCHGLVHLRIGTVVTPTPTPTATPTPTPTPIPTATPTSQRKRPPSAAKPAATATAAATSNSATASPAPSPAAPSRVLKSNEFPVTLAQLGKGMDRAKFLGVTAVVAFVVLFLPVFLVWKIVRRQKSPDANNKQTLFETIVSALFLDRETATYSLSKFQFYLWTAASVIGYLYLEASTCIVQGMWKFIDIPSNLPSIVFISATTGALAQFATVQRGPKGAGEEHPSLADFVSVGGVMSPDRVQFFIWTIIGALVFLGLVFQQDPASISSLPTVPDGFLQLMGISSLGYLSGKVARPPGPVINDIALAVEERTVKKNGTTQTDPNAKPKPFSIVTLRGRILSPDADFKIVKEGKEVPLTGDLAPKDITILEPDEQSSKLDRSAKKLELTIEQPDLKWLRGASSLTISNPDGQRADWSLPAGPQLQSITASQTETDLKLTLTGKNLAPAATFWIDGGEITKAQPPPTAIKAETDANSASLTGLTTTKLNLTISNATATWKSPGEHKLTIVNPDGQSAEGTYTVAEKPTIESITASKTGADLKLSLKGKNVDQAATFRIDGEEITKAQLPTTAIKANADPTSPGLDVTISSPDTQWMAGEHTLMIVNPDGQSAEAKYTIA